MSFVSVVGSKSFLTVMCDGRVVGLEDEVLEEDYQKFVRIGKKSFIAYAGTRHICESIANNFKHYEGEKEDYTFWLEKIKLILAQNQVALKQSGYKAILAFGGINLNGEIEFYAISSITLEFQRYFPQADNLSYTFLLNSEDFEDELGNGRLVEKLTEFLGQTGYSTPSQVIQSQRLLNNYVADIDKVYVNKNTSRLVIKNA
ncbi:hypothetical protein [Fontibacillus sp. BL9]|uniref:hypothetical protein n=1 Tax=Fontibacillus sp. BL9 TaxID=3389971 RepID=UPI00397DDB80